MGPVTLLEIFVVLFEPGMHLFVLFLVLARRRKLGYALCDNGEYAQRSYVRDGQNMGEDPFNCR